MENRIDKTFTYEEIEGELKDLIDDSHPEIKIGQLTYLAGDVLRKLDPIAFSQEVLAFIDCYYDEVFTDCDNELYTRKEEH